MSFLMKQEECVVKNKRKKCKKKYKYKNKYRTQNEINGVIFYFLKINEKNRIKISYIHLCS